MALDCSGSALGVHGAVERAVGARRVLPRPVQRPRPRVMLSVLAGPLAFLVTSLGVVLAFRVA